MFTNSPRKIVPIIIDTLYINPHSNERVKIKINNLTQDIKSYIVKQVGKNNKEIEFNRVVVPYDSHYIIMNIYQDNDTKKFYGKTLTVLTEQQLKTSRNMNCGRAEEYMLKLTFKSIREEDRFFDYRNNFIDYLNQY